MGNITTEIDSSVREHDVTQIKAAEPLIITQDSFDQRFKKDYICPTELRSGLKKSSIVVLDQEYAQDYV